MHSPVRASSAQYAVNFSHTRIISYIWLATTEQGATTLIWKSRTWVELFFLANRLTLHDEVTYAHLFTTLLIEKEKKILPQTGHSTYTHSLGIEI